MSATMNELCVLQVADCRFLGFVKAIRSESEALDFQNLLMKQHPQAAHVPLCFGLPQKNYWKFDEDGEPPDSCGPELLRQVKGIESKNGVALVVVRYFGEKFLGVTCGRLSDCYSSVAKLALHRFFHPDEPLVEEIPKATRSRYGFAAGDCELVLNVVQDPDNCLLERLRDELEFEGFKGSQGEVLPRLQNLQADTSKGTIPIYRYPGNYSGDEWETFEWSPASLQIKQSVEQKLMPIVQQEMNHCVTNYYRDGNDFIQHHSDKDLDLNQSAVIVSVSLGDERILELKRRAEPKDITRVPLPHCSMLVLGPKTNKLFTHSILKNEGSRAPRISLTLRDVKTFMDLCSKRLYGQGVQTKSIEQVKRAENGEDCLFVLGISAVSSLILSQRKSRFDAYGALALVLAAAVTMSLRSYRIRWRKGQEERLARDFFSKASTSGTKY